MRRAGALLQVIVAQILLGPLLSAGVLAIAIPLELTAASFRNALGGLPGDSYVLLELYSGWCPACKRFQPHYQKVAAHYASNPSVAVVRVDCAEESALCARFKVQAYPSMRFGRAADVAEAQLDTLDDVEPTWRTARTVISTVDELLSKRGTQVEGQQQQEQQSKVDLVDVEGATIRSWQYLLPAGLFLDGPEARDALKEWVQLLAQSHPVPRCQESAAHVLHSLDGVWPTGQQQPKEAMQSFQICGNATFQDWRSCKGSQPGARGYTCGLWLLFHALASRLPDQPSVGAAWLATIKAFVKHFFQCDDCSKHFLAMASDAEAAAVDSKRDAVQWVWRAHNKVNARLEAEAEDAGDARDKDFPHLQWPAQELCPACRLANSDAGGVQVQWDEQQVYSFLLAYYGANGTSLQAAAGREHLVRQGSWGSASLIVAATAAVVYGSLGKTVQYSVMRQSYSRMF